MGRARTQPSRGGLHAILRQDGEAELDRACRQLAKLAALACEKAGVEAAKEVVEAAAEIAADTIHDGDDSVRPDDDTPMPAHWTEGPKCGFYQDITWTSSVLNDEDLEPAQAPSARAWSLYESFGRNDDRRQEFWKMFGPSLLTVDGRRRPTILGVDARTSPRTVGFLSRKSFHKLRIECSPSSSHQAFCAVVIGASPRGRGRSCLTSNG